MKIEEFIEKIIEQFQDYSGVRITSETIMRDLDEWDSLTGMAVQLTIQDDLNASIPDDEFLNAKTIGDLYDLMIKHKKQ